MSYAMFLEEYNAAQDTVSFAEMAEALNSIIECATEDITLDFSISLESAADAEVLKEAAEEAKKNAFARIKEALVKWALKAIEWVKNFGKKAAIAVANGGNKAINKLVSSKATIRKNIQLRVSLYNGKETTAIISDLTGNLAMIEGITPSTLKNSDSKLRDIRDKVKDSLNDIKAKKSDFKSAEQVAGSKVSDLNRLYVDPYIKHIDYKNVTKAIDKAAAYAKNLADKGMADANFKTGETLHPDEVKSLSTIGSTLMQLGSALMNFAFENLSTGVANAAKIALACGVRPTEKKEEPEE